MTARWPTASPPRASKASRRSSRSRAISAWYNYSRTGGVRHNTNYPAGLNRQHHAPRAAPTTRRAWTCRAASAICAPVNNDISNDANVDTGDGDTHGDINTFWRDRDYIKDASKVKAAVFATHGIQDDNVRMDHVGHVVGRAEGQQRRRASCGCCAPGHEDPFESRRAEWVTTLHRWFDYWLYGVTNGIMTEPAVTIEDAEGRLGRLRRLADPRHAERRRLPALDRTRHGRQPRRHRRRRRRRHAAVHRRPTPARPR